MVKFTLNGEPQELNVPSANPLLWVLRESLELTGTKFGCGIAQCRACTVLINGEAVPSCQLPLEVASDADITTIEGLGKEKLHVVQQVWIENSVPQCGYCQSGMILACVALLRKNPNPTDADIDEHIGNLCRCGTYPKIREAIHQAAKLARSEKA